ncbi:MAG: hypothetical protein Q4A37_02175 [Candidatus Saccharibacteria bacterium]|nr:hypothetical protein [Candidatus Saccharibacteria bacterium]
MSEVDNINDHKRIASGIAAFASSLQVLVVMALDGRLTLEEVDRAIITPKVDHNETDDYIGLVLPQVVIPDGANRILLDRILTKASAILADAVLRQCSGEDNRIREESDKLLRLALNSL